MNRLIHPVPGLLWTEIRVAAAEYAAHGWPVVPGTYQIDLDGPWLGMPGATGLAPAKCPMESPVSVECAEEVWTRLPYTPLFACFAGWGALRLTIRAARVAVTAMRGAGVPAPVVTWAEDAYVLVTAPSGHSGVHHAPLPPGVVGGTPARWLCPPEECGWTPPPATEVLSAMSSAGITARDLGPRGPVAA